jgi:hypothetical protein
MFAPSFKFYSLSFVNLHVLTLILNDEIHLATRRYIYQDILEDVKEYMIDQHQGEIQSQPQGRLRSVTTCIHK